MIPLLYRTNLQESEYVKLYSYARVRKNQEVNVLKWYTQNISHQEINQLLIKDILEKKGKYACFGNEQLKLYEKIANSKNSGFKDFIKLENNIIIYNGLTGTFTNILRKGNFFDKKKILLSFIKDAKYLQAILNQFYLDNPTSQIYVIGIPNIMNLNLTHIFDYYLKSAALSIPNAIYINGETRNFCLKFNHQQEYDIHYSKPEYLLLLNRIFMNIQNNFYTLPFKGKLLADLAKYSQDMELQYKNSKTDIKVVYKIIKKYLEIYANKIDNTEQVLNDIATYYDKNYLLHYSTTNREEVMKLLKKLSSK